MVFLLRVEWLNVFWVAASHRSVQIV